MKQMKQMIVEWIEAQIEIAGDAIPVLGVSGAQGAGKSTAMRAVNEYFGGRVAVLGIDDFYLTRAERAQLASQIHPLFVTRGPPGTHDLAMLNTVIDQLLAAKEDSHVSIPRFEKVDDDRTPIETWSVFEGRPRAIIVEGWLIGAYNDPGSPTKASLNAIEEQDQDGAWRVFQEEQLAGPYRSLWGV